MAGLFHEIFEEVDKRIARALTRIGFTGSTLDAGQIGGALPPSVQSTLDHNHTTTTGDGGDLDGPRVGDFAEFTEVAAPATPASGLVRIYAKADGNLYQKDDAGIETALSGSGLSDHNHTTAGGDGGDLDGARVGDFMEYAESAAPSTPASGFVRIYAKSDGNFYQKDDAGTETSLATTGSAHVIEEETTPLTQRANLSFQGAGVVATDDAGNNRTVVTIAGGSGGELDYAQITSSHSVTATTDATATTVVSSSAIAYNGSTVVIIEFYAFGVTPAASQAVVLNLWDGATDLGRFGQVSQVTQPVHLVRRLTPSAATHTYHVKAWKTSGTASVEAGAGGVATNLPAFIRITRA